MIKVGTSGFSFPDWIGTAYPPNIKKGDMLPYYEKELGFTITEINATYYTIPSQKSFTGMIRKTSSDFEFTVKAHKSLTHEIRDRKTGKRVNNHDAFEQFRYAIEPLKKEGRLSAILAQFPYSFHATKENYDYLITFREKLSDIPLVVEFRNFYWHCETSLAFLKQHHIGYCVVDEPKLRGLMPYNPTITTDLGYFRLHGRNTNWFHASVEERYNYLYTKELLRDFLTDAQFIDHYVKETIVMFNNCHSGQAARNALELMAMLK
ncbi:MAG: DUF72 domain-containing protein [Candidatus Brocadiaceae bacterium]|nr:DUF72 domain-containing protein [Candidatus Brocadiaceae bacterium]